MDLWFLSVTWWRHLMVLFSALLALCEGNSPVTVEFPSQKPVRRSFDIFFDLCLSKRLSKQSWGWWFGTPLGSSWRHCNDLSELLYITPHVYTNLTNVSHTNNIVTAGCHFKYLGAILWYSIFHLYGNWLIEHLYFVIYYRTRDLISNASTHVAFIIIIRHAI